MSNGTGDTTNPDGFHIKMTGNNVSWVHTGDLHRIRLVDDSLKSSSQDQNGVKVTYAHVPFRKRRWSYRI